MEIRRGQATSVSTETLVPNNPRNAQSLSVQTGQAGRFPRASALGLPPLHPVSQSPPVFTRSPLTPTAGNRPTRKKSLIRSDRAITHGRKSMDRRRGSTISMAGRRASVTSTRGGQHVVLNKQTGGWWRRIVKTLTCCLPAPMLRCCGMRDRGIQLAFREKLALCIIIFLIMVLIGFVTLFFTQVACLANGGLPAVGYKELTGGSVQYMFAIRGKAFDTRQALSIWNGNPHPNARAVIDYPQIAGKDLSHLFPVVSSGCQERAKQMKRTEDATFALPCTIPGVWPPGTNTPAQGGPAPFACHSQPQGVQGIAERVRSAQKADLFLQYQDVQGDKRRLIFNGKVWDISRINEIENVLDPKIMSIIRNHAGMDATKALSQSADIQDTAVCLDEVFRIAQVDATNFGCVLSTVIFYICLGFTLGTVLAKFLLAVLFQWLIGWRMGQNGKDSRVAADLKRRRKEGNASITAVQPQPIVTNSGAAKSNVESIQIVPLGDNAKGKGKERHLSSLHITNPSDPSSPTEDSAPIPLEPRRRSMKTVTPIRAPDGKIMQPTLPSVENEIPEMGTLTRFRDLQLAATQTQTDPILSDPTLMHTLIMVPCYSENQASLRATLDSLARTYYPATHKTLFVVADGNVKGSGNDRSTPEYLIDMMEIDRRFKDEDPKNGHGPHAYTYVAVANGSKRKNYAKVYAGWYAYALTDATGRDATHSTTDESSTNSMSRTLTNRKKGRVPMILVVKCGNEEERDPSNKSTKPGNRGKRDSQILLMQFLSKVMFDDRMTELEFDIFHKLWTITGVHPDVYEAVMMVDADTRVYPDSLTHLVCCFKRDAKIMGVCGETRIWNKWESWVTMIQVYEYYISHHLSKAFESVFGGVTCLPGCFSAYRIKAPKNDLWVPILANPDVVEEYSENVVESLHDKNLLLLGEDRFLTTLMLKAFPKRRNVFVPQALCKTVVPSSFSVLLSQRRRWINSTLHNLLELVLVRDLCGTFCFSMQFVIFMELIGSVLLPAALAYMIYIVTITIFRLVHENLTLTFDVLLPIIQLGAIICLPAMMILLTIRSWKYIWWFFVYILALPVWQFILPLYSFWHFDDFSWGETRVVTGEEGRKAADHSRRDGEFDHNGIFMKTWKEWMRERTIQEDRKRGAFGQGQSMSASGPTPGPTPSRNPSVPHSAGFAPRPSIAIPPPLFGPPPPGSRPVRASSSGHPADFGRAPFSAPASSLPFSPPNGTATMRTPTGTPPLMRAPTGTPPLMRTPTGTPPPLYPPDARASQMWYPPYPFTPASAALASSPGMGRQKSAQPQHNLGYFPVQMQMPPTPHQRPRASTQPPLSAVLQQSSPSTTLQSPKTPGTVGTEDSQQKWDAGWEYCTCNVASFSLDLCSPFTGDVMFVKFTVRTVKLAAKSSQMGYKVWTICECAYGITHRKLTPRRMKTVRMAPLLRYSSVHKKEMLHILSLRLRTPSFSRGTFKQKTGAGLGDLNSPFARGQLAESGLICPTTEWIEGRRRELNVSAQRVQPGILYGIPAIIVLIVLLAIIVPVMTGSRPELMNPAGPPSGIIQVGACMLGMFLALVIGGTLRRRAILSAMSTTEKLSDDFNKVDNARGMMWRYIDKGTSHPESTVELYAFSAQSASLLAQSLAPEPLPAYLPKLTPGDSSPIYPPAPPSSGGASGALPAYAPVAENGAKRFAEEMRV
ncbi:chitin synthase-domain-containing protein [Fimicolochytrium jonesii]|uniref:chitin synthase-domain-containing protein n=1 Tax=Fimicolochytrium jonesii TaxID=1396493 RepID=UPI0022FE44AB|nr:chitin synthase-domain-containing protein [Fimicolochytrium jonesii]KAI8825108.1 chitin synthase-domain-containing protein [Fimicolochytrium jonesii]